MDSHLIKRMDRAITRCGGAAGLLDILNNMPADVKQAVINCPDYATKVKMVEMIADRIAGGK